MAALQMPSIIGITKESPNEWDNIIRSKLSRMLDFLSIKK